MDTIIGYKCKDCGAIYVLRRIRCLKCKGSTFEKINLPDECSLLTYTLLYATPKGVQEMPLPLGIVEFKGLKGVRATGQLLTTKPSIEMSMKPTWGQVRKLDHKEVNGFKFIPKS